MLVVSNTSPLTNLAAIDQFGLLRDLFGEIHLARGVWRELNAGGIAHPGSPEVANASWVQRHDVPDSPLVRTLHRDLDPGESETLALAVQLKASLVLLDEREARHSAERLGLRPFGVVGILLRAKQLGMLDAVRPQLTALRERAGFYLSNRLVNEALRAAGEARP